MSFYYKNPRYLQDRVSIFEQEIKKEHSNEQSYILLLHNIPSDKNEYLFDIQMLAEDADMCLLVAFDFSQCF